MAAGLLYLFRRVEDIDDGALQRVLNLELEKEGGWELGQTYSSSRTNPAYVWINHIN